MQAAGIRLGDTRFIDMYDEYKEMKDMGEKVSYIVAHLADKYAISERKVYSLIKRFQSDCKPIAV